MLTDTFGRSITYLRISVTDRCNMRCVYCLPPDGVVSLEHEAILRYEEIAAFVSVAARHGIRSVRLTGGEPLVRKNLASLVGMLAEIPGIEDISLTTNGLALADQVEELATAGLKRINVSLDTLDADRFRRITRGANIEKVWSGIAAAERVGLSPIKINTVAMRGVNDDELLDIARLSIDHDWHMRFIELMPVQNQQSWGEGFPQPQAAFIPIGEVRQLMADLDLEAVERDAGSGPAREYHPRGGRGRIGFISPVSEHFCASCNRLRLTADGNLRPCLLSDREIPIRQALRNGEDLLPYLQQAVDRKPDGHHIGIENPSESAVRNRCMRQIGG